MTNFVLILITTSCCWRGFISGAICRRLRLRGTSSSSVSIYYEICGRYHYLYWDLGGSLATISCYLDQRCLVIYIWETITHKREILWDLFRSHPSRVITSFFQPISRNGGTKCCVDSPTMDANFIRLVRQHASFRFADR